MHGEKTNWMRDLIPSQVKGEGAVWLSVASRTEQPPLRATNRSLLEQMRITSTDIARRKSLLRFDEIDINALTSYRSHVREHIDGIVDAFYDEQTAIPEIDLLIGDADTLKRLRSSMRGYVLQLFGGDYGKEYVNSRLRVGLVHKRIGVEPKLYFSAMFILQSTIRRCIHLADRPAVERELVLIALDKLFAFDTQLVFDTYIRSFMSALEAEKNKVEAYADSLEAKIALRTHQLAELSRKDGLTDLLNQRTFYEELQRALLLAQQDQTPISVVYLDCDDFKEVNDTEGHLAGDQLLVELGNHIASSTPEGCFAARYGGDEFCLLLPNYHLELAEHVVDALVALAQESDFPLALSVGIASTGPEDFVDMDVLVRAADSRMYEAKNHQGTFVVSGPATHVRRSLRVC